MTDEAVKEFLRQAGSKGGKKTTELYGGKAQSEGGKKGMESRWGKKKKKKK